MDAKQFSRFQVAAQQRHGWDLRGTVWMVARVERIGLMPLYV